MRSDTLEQKSADALAGLQIDILSKLRKGSMSFEQIRWFKNLSFDQRKFHMKHAFLRPVSEDKPLIIDALDGIETLAGASNLFLAGIHEDLKDGNINKPGAATPETPVQVHQITENALLMQVVGYLGRADIAKLFLTQAQIKKFCQKYPEKLTNQESLSTFFLSEFPKEELSLIEVVHSPEGLWIAKCSLSYGFRNPYEKYPRQIVIPCHSDL